MKAKLFTKIHFFQTASVSVNPAKFDNNPHLFSIGFFYQNFCIYTYTYIYDYKYTVIMGWLDFLISI
jgi:hypothetical protein